MPGIAAVSGLLGAAEPRVMTRKVNFHATLEGRSGRFRLQGQEKTDGLNIFGGGSKEWKAEGLLIVAEDGNSFELLDESKSPCEHSVATKIVDTEMNVLTKK